MNLDALGNLGEERLGRAIENNMQLKSFASYM
jgi:hypothetical protein